MTKRRTKKANAPDDPGVGGGVVDIDTGPSVDDDGGLAPGGGGPGSEGPSPGDEGPSDGELDTVDPVPHLAPPPQPDEPWRVQREIVDSLDKTDVMHSGGSDS